MSSTTTTDSCGGGPAGLSAPLDPAATVERLRSMRFETSSTSRMLPFGSMLAPLTAFNSRRQPVKPRTTTSRFCITVSTWNAWGLDAVPSKTQGPTPMVGRPRSDCLLYTSDAADDLLCVDI